MNWTSIDQDLCNQCGICVGRCPLSYRDQDGAITSTASEMTCNLCGHCVALCPTGAIAHLKMDMNNFIDLDQKIPFDTDTFIQFVRGRRSHRQFKDKVIERKDLETLADLCRYAPTGSNRQMVELDIIQDSEKMQRLSDHTVDFFEENINRLKASPDEKIIFQGRLIPPDLIETLKRVIMARQYGLEVIFHKAPVVMIFHCPPNVSCPKDDCVIASTTVTLAARCLGLDTCYIGLFEFAANEYGPIIEELDLPPGNQVFSVLILGYPKLKFYKTVDRKPMGVRWR